MKTKLTILFGLLGVCWGKMGQVPINVLIHNSGLILVAFVETKNTTTATLAVKNVLKGNIPEKQRLTIKLPVTDSLKVEVGGRHVIFVSSEGTEAGLRQKVERNETYVFFLRKGKDSVYDLASDWVGSWPIFSPVPGNDSGQYVLYQYPLNHILSLNGSAGLIKVVDEGQKKGMELSNPQKCLDFDELSVKQKECRIYISRLKNYVTMKRLD